MKPREKIGYARAVGALLRSVVTFRLAKLMIMPLKLTVLSLALMKRCNSRCTVCNIWKRSIEVPDLQSREMSSGEIAELLSSPLFCKLV